MPFDPYGNWYVDDRISGKQGIVLWGGAPTSNPSQPPGVILPVTNWSPKVTKMHRDLTSSIQYDSNSQLVWPIRIPEAILIEIDIEGRFRLNTVPQTILKVLFEGDNSNTIVQVALYLNPTNCFCNGYFSIESFSMSIPMDDIVNYVATIKSYGVIKIGDFGGMPDNSDGGSPGFVFSL